MQFSALASQAARQSVSSVADGSIAKAEPTEVDNRSVSPRARSITCIVPFPKHASKHVLINGPSDASDIRVVRNPTSRAIDGISGKGQDPTIEARGPTTAIQPGGGGGPSGRPTGHRERVVLPGYQKSGLIEDNACSAMRAPLNRPPAI